MHWFKKRETAPPRHKTATILQGLADRRVSKSTVILADMIEQSKYDKTGHMFQRLMLEGELTQLIWNMRAVGEDWRGEVGHVLYQSGGKLHAWPDPRSVYSYSNSALISRACKLEGIHLVKMSEHARHYAQQRTSVPVVACMWTFGDQRPPMLYLDYEPPPRSTKPEQMARTKFWRWQAAQVLGHFIARRALYTGALVPPDMIVPADPEHDRAWTALMHTFAKAFLYLGNWPVWCPEGAGCPCNDILMGAAQGPEHHPENTDFLDARELRGPAGERARHAAQITPPPGRSPYYAPRHQPRPTRPTARPQEPFVPPSMPSIPDFEELGLANPDDEDDGTADLDPSYRTSYQMPSVRPTHPPSGPPSLDDTQRLR